MAEIDIDPDTHNTLMELAAESGEPMAQVLASAVRSEQKRRFLEKVTRTYERLYNVVREEVRACEASPLMEQT